MTDEKRREYMRARMKRYRAVQVLFDTEKPADMELYEFIQAQPNKSELIKRLIAQQMNSKAAR